ncbi:hypothetical protein [Chromobacterium sphagni]|uniref:hypothetical protein n=1 Tax=Chromobacterium sphagni TaxID=1903179 RepID=UPI0011134840|nr:hypothetical protein [Chromobacterium sphagni]
MVIGTYPQTRTLFYQFLQYKNGNIKKRSGQEIFSGAACKNSWKRQTEALQNRSLQKSELACGPVHPSRAKVIASTYRCKVIHFSLRKALLEPDSPASGNQASKAGGKRKLSFIFNDMNGSPHWKNPCRHYSGQLAADKRAAGFNMATTWAAVVKRRVFKRWTARRARQARCFGPALNDI